MAVGTCRVGFPGVHIHSTDTRDPPRVPALHAVKLPARSLGWGAGGQHETAKYKTMGYTRRQKLKCSGSAEEVAVYPDHTHLYL